MDEALALPSDGADAALRPRLSVLLPLGDARDDAAENLAFWTDAQTCDALDFQIVAVTDGSDPQMEQAVFRKLRPHDKVVNCPTDEHVLARMARGSQQAEGDILFFAEHHCLPDANCVAATLRFFDARPDISAGVFTERQRAGTAHGHLDRRWFAEMEALDVRTHDRTKLVSGGFAMRKSAYAALGGHDGRYGMFADEILTVAAKERRMVTDRISDTAMTHITATMREHQHHVEDYTRGECAFRAANDLGFCERHFGHAHVWANRQALDPGLARTSAVILGRVLASELRSARNAGAMRDIASLLRELGRRLALATFGPRPAHACAVLATRWAELRTTLLNVSETERWNHFHRAWRRMVEAARLGSAIDHCQTPAAIPPTPDASPIADIPETQRIGFHGLEAHQGMPFRWSEPVMMVRIARPPGRTRVCIEMLPLRDDHARCIKGIFWGKRRIGDATIDAGGIRFPVDVTSSEPQWLTIVVSPIYDGRGPQGLGIPVRALSFAAE